MSHLEIGHIVLIVVLAVAVVTDVRCGKIRNWLTLPAIAAGPIIYLIDGGTKSALLSLEGAGVMILVSAVLVAVGIFGGGDIKLLIASGSLGGLTLVYEILVYTGIAGGLLALIMLVQRKRTRAVVKSLAVTAWLRMAHSVSIKDGVSSGVKMPYSIAIAAGTVAAMFLPL